LSALGCWVHQNCYFGGWIWPFCWAPRLDHYWSNKSAAMTINQ
jgi:hypothetical protein